MNPCTGHPRHLGCAHEGGIQRGIHWPYCIARSDCEGCMPWFDLSTITPKPTLDLSIFRKDA